MISAIETIITRIPFTHGDAASAGRAGNLRLVTMKRICSAMS